MQDEIENAKIFIEKYSKSNDKIAIIELLKTLIVFLFCYQLINLKMNFLGCFIFIFNYLRMFIQFHDMAHYSFFKNSNTNRIIGKILGMFVCHPLDLWRDVHNKHHRKFGKLEDHDGAQTILFTKKEYENFTKITKIFVRILREPFIFQFLLLPLYMTTGHIYYCFKYYGIFSSVVFEKAISIYFYYLIGSYYSFKIFFLIHLSTSIGGLLFHFQHSVNTPYRKNNKEWSIDQASLQGSTYLLIPNIFKFFSCGVEYHHIHHLNTKVPSYNLVECHRGYGDEKWKTLGVNFVNIYQMIKAFNNVMYDEENDRYIPF